jgi:type IV secretory pathway TrbF-like protein
MNNGMMADAEPIIIGCLFVLLQAVVAVGGTVLLICTLAACFRCFQSEQGNMVCYMVDAEVGWLTSSGDFKNVTKPRNEDLEEKIRTLLEVDAQLCYEENLSTWFEDDTQLGFVVAV